MPRLHVRPRRSTVLWAGLTLSLIIGWGLREMAHARDS